MRFSVLSSRLLWSRVCNVLLVPLLAVSLGADTGKDGCGVLNSPEEQARRICNIYMKWGAKDCSMAEQMRVRSEMSSSALAELAGAMGLAAGAAVPFDWRGRQGSAPRPVCPTCSGSKLHGDGSEIETCPTCKGNKTLPSGNKCGWCDGAGTQPKACDTCKGSGEGE